MNTDRLAAFLELLLIAAITLVVFFAIGTFVANAYIADWQRNCDAIGAIVVDGVTYDCKRREAGPE